jgi:translation initiation factor 3 subunit M
MATGAGQGISGIPGAEEAKAKGKATKKPKPPVRVRPSVPYSTPYEDGDTISPPSIPNERFFLEGLYPDDPDPVTFNSPVHLAHEPGFCTPRHVQARLDGAADYLFKHQFFNDKTPRDPPVIARMAAPQLIFVDGSIAELAQEMADYVQIGEQVKPLLEREQTEEALQAIVKASHVLNSVPEKDFTGAYNLLVHLVLQSKDPKKYLPVVCGNLLKPITSSPTHGFTLAANALSTVFNLLEPDNALRYNVMLQIARFIRQHNQFDVLKPRLKNLEDWFAAWDTDEEDQRRLYVEVSDAAAEGGDDE